MEEEEEEPQGRRLERRGPENEREGEAEEAPRREGSVVWRAWGAAGLRSWAEPTGPVTTLRCH